MKADFDRLPPHSLEAEQGVLGCVFLDPVTSMPLCIESTNLDAFYDLRHQQIYSLLLEMHDDGAPIDLLTVRQRLADSGQLEAVGGVDYLCSLQDVVPSASNIGYYLEILKDKYIRRSILRTCSGVAADVYENEGNTQELLDRVEKAILQIDQDCTRKESAGIKELINGAINWVEEMHQNQGAIQGIATGFRDLDKMTNGLKPGNMVVIAARPSMGKTSLAMNIAEHVAVDQGIAVGVFSLEMTSEELAQRMLCSRSRVNIRDLQRNGFLAERDFPKLTGASVKIGNAPLYIDDSSGLTILQLRAKARRMHQRHAVKLLVIDYLQLLKSDNRRAENRQQEVADISNGIKALAKELGVPVIVLAQFNRELEKDKGRKPRLSDLRESGSIEQDADLVCLLYKTNRGEDEDDPVENSDTVAVSLLVAKQRNGPTGDVYFTFRRSFTRFESAAKVDRDDMPSGHRNPHND